MKELQAKAKVTQTMTRDGLVVENQGGRHCGERFQPGGGTGLFHGCRRARPKKILERAEDIKDGHKNKKKSEKGAAETAATAESEDGLHRSAARLELTEEERADPALQPYIQKAEAKGRQAGCGPRRSAEKRVPVKEKSLRCRQRQGKIHPAF